MSNISQCAYCEREINLEKDMQTYCTECQKDFCFSMMYPCFSEYHRGKELHSGHAAISICTPSWKVKLKSSEKDLEK